MAVARGTPSSPAKGVIYKKGGASKTVPRTTYARGKAKGATQVIITTPSGEKIEKISAVSTKTGEGVILERNIPQGQQQSQTSNDVQTAATLAYGREYLSYSPLARQKLERELVEVERRVKPGTYEVLVGDQTLQYTRQNLPYGFPSDAPLSKGYKQKYVYDVAVGQILAKSPYQPLQLVLKDPTVRIKTNEPQGVLEGSYNLAEKPGVFRKGLGKTEAFLASTFTEGTLRSDELGSYINEVQGYAFPKVQEYLKKSTETQATKAFENFESGKYATFASRTVLATLSELTLTGLKTPVTTGVGLVGLYGAAKYAPKLVTGAFVGSAGYQIVTAPSPYEKLTTGISTVVTFGLFEAGQRIVKPRTYEASKVLKIAYDLKGSKLASFKGFTLKKKRKLKIVKTPELKTTVTIDKKVFIIYPANLEKGTLGKYYIKSKEIYYDPKQVKRQSRKEGMGSEAFRKEVILHEIGHKLDYEYNVNINLEGLPKKETFTKDQLARAYPDYPVADRPSEKKADLYASILKGRTSDYFPVTKERALSSFKSAGFSTQIPEFSSPYSIKLLEAPPIKSRQYKRLVVVKSYYGEKEFYQEARSDVLIQGYDAFGESFSKVKPKAVPRSVYKIIEPTEPLRILEAEGKDQFGIQIGGKQYSTSVVKMKGSKYYIYDIIDLKTSKFSTKIFREENLDLALIKKIKGKREPDIYLTEATKEISISDVINIPEMRAETKVTRRTFKGVPSKLAKIEASGFGIQKITEKLSVQTVKGKQATELIMDKPFTIDYTKNLFYPDTFKPKKLDTYYKFVKHPVKEKPIIFREEPDLIYMKIPAKSYTQESINIDEGFVISYSKKQPVRTRILRRSLDLALDKTGQISVGVQEKLIKRPSKIKLEDSVKVYSFVPSFKSIEEPLISMGLGITTRGKPISKSVNKSILELTQEQKIATKTRKSQIKLSQSKQIQSLSIKELQNVLQTSKPISKQKQQQRQTQLQQQQQRQTQQQQQLQMRQITKQTFTFKSDFIRKPPPPPKIFLFNKDYETDKVKKKRKGGKSIRRYTPSITSLEFGIRGKIFPELVKTGLDIRPIPIKIKW